MTEIKRAKEFLIKETYCQFNKCDYDLDCGVCECNTDSYGYDEDTEKSIYDLAIRSLTAWEEVLQELEKKNALYMSYLSNKENPYDSELFGKHIAVENCIDIIKQKLEQIEE